MASKREVVVATENYLRSKGYNNSTGKYDRVIMGVKSLLGETLLAYGSPEFERAIQQETERMLKKYVKDSAMEYDPVMCMMVPKKANDEYFKKGEVYKNQSGSTVKIDWYDKNGDVQYTHNKQSQSATEKGLKHMLERNGYKKVNDAKTMVYDEVMAMMKPANAKDKRTTDFSSGDAKKPFEYIDRLVTKDMNDYPREIERAKTPADCERLENAIRTTLDNVVDEYLQIWNEVGLYAQKRKNEVVDRYGKLMSQAFKKYNELKARE